MLEITPSATDADIKKAFRKLALRYHPRRQSRGGDEFAAERFKLVCMAYDVLSNECRRATYDQFGDEGLKRGVPAGGSVGQWTHGYTFHGDCLMVFREFFGGDNPYQEYYDRVDGDLKMGFGGLMGIGALKQDDLMEKDLWLRLDEVFHGCTKKMKILKKVLESEGKKTTLKEKVLTITVKRGWMQGTRITFPREGDQGPNKVPADIVFILRDKPHELLHREGHNLIYTTSISLHKALTGTTLRIDTVDDRILHVPITDIVTPGYTKRVVGEGMPLPTDPSKKGDMLIKFLIQFPSFLPQDKKQLIRMALPADFTKPDAEQQDSTQNYQ